MIWRRVKRLVWIAAWSFWAFVGWRLYVEFPRTLGEPFERIELDSGTVLLGPIHGTPLLIAVAKVNGDAQFIRVLHVHRQEVVDSWTILPERPAFSGVHGVAIAKQRTAAGAKESEEVVAIDLRTDRTVVLPCKDAELYGAVFHPTRPWVALEVAAKSPATRPDDPQTEWVVFDFTTGAAVARFPALTNRATPIVYLRPLAFAAETGDLLFGKTIVDKANGAADGHLVARRVDEPNAPERMISTKFVELPTPTHGTRVAFVSRDAPTEREGFRANVVDLRTGATVHTHEMSSRDRMSRQWWLSVNKQIDLGHPLLNQLADAPLAFSNDGETLVDFASGLAANLRDGRRAWELPEGEFPIGRDRTGDAFEVAKIWALDPWQKRWEAEVGGRIPWLSIASLTHAVRDMKTGRVVYRAQQPSTPAAPDCDWRLTGGGLCYHSPPQVQWWLLLGLQATLASPLVLLYTMRWWGWRRRKLP